MNYRNALRLLGKSPNTSYADIAIELNIRPIQMTRPYRNGRMTAPISFPIRPGTPSYNNFIESNIITRASNIELTQQYILEGETSRDGGNWETFTKTFTIKGVLRQLDMKAKYRAEMNIQKMRDSNVDVRNWSWKPIGEPEPYDKKVGKTKMKMKMGWLSDIKYIQPTKRAITKPLDNYFPALKIEGEPEQTWNTNKGQCVQDYLTDFYKEQIGMVKEVKKEDWLFEILSKGDKIKIEELKEQGVSIDDLKIFCEEKRVNMMAYDANDNSIIYYKVENPNEHLKPLMFRCLNAHIYPLMDNERKSYRERIKWRDDINLIVSSDINPPSNLPKKEKKPKKDKKNKPIKLREKEKDDEEETKWNCLFMEDRDAPYKMNEKLDFMLDYIINEGLPHPSGKNRFNFDDGAITELIYSKNKVKVFAKQKDYFAEEYCYRNNINYKGQTTTDLCLQEINKFFGIERWDKNPFISNYNPIVRDNLIRAKGGRSRIGLLDPSFQETEYTNDNELRKMISNGDAIAYDIEKCYSSLLKDPKDDWIVYDYKDEMEKYDGVLKTGLYWVNTNDTTIFKKSNWYSNKLIEMANDFGIQYKIIRQILPSQTKKNMFHAFIEEVYLKSGKDEKTTKLIINSLTGLFGKSQRSITSINITTDETEMYELIETNNDNEIIMKDYIYNGQRFWIYGTIDNKIWLSSCIPMYIQILDWSNMKLFQMEKQIGGLPIYRKVDMTICIGGKIIDEPNHKDITTWGSYRYIEPEKVKISLINIEKCYDGDLINEKSWYVNEDYTSSNQADDILEFAILNGGCLIQGDAGTGKSHIISKANEKALKIAPTNCASRNIKGQTIHRGLGINDENKLAEVKILGYRDIPYIIVDEIGLVSFELLVRLMILKSYGFTIICFGDLENQLPPVETDRLFMEDFSYKNHSILKYICGNNKVVLIENFRQKSQPEFIEIANKVKIGFVPDLPRINYSIEELAESKIIVYMNKTREYINNKIMNAIKPNDALFIDYKPKDDDDKARPLYLFVGLRLMAIHNDMKLELINSDEFIVKEYNETDFIIENEWGETKTIPINNIHKYFVVNYASTIYKNQSLTIKSPRKVIIYDWDFQKKYRRVLYTIITRVQNIEQLSIGV